MRVSRRDFYDFLKICDRVFSCDKNGDRYYSLTTTDDDIVVFQEFFTTSNNLSIASFTRTGNRYEYDVHFSTVVDYLLLQLNRK